ncbi:MAG: phosphate acyltransferase PlsX [Gammaproteobacteria bacterium]|nr:phosphate acyltransferase PlsX [Gammaproteobacteria bacterium]
MSRPCRIAVDLLGAELPAADLLNGATDALKQHPNCELTFICDQRTLNESVSSSQRIIHCEHWVREQDTLREVLSERRTSSMHIGMHLLKEAAVDGFVSVGSTGALMALGRFLLHTPQGIDRPAVIKEFDGRQRSFWMLDLGANIVRKPSTLHQFARLGMAYASQVGKVKKPRVALLNIGIEERKGPALLRDAAEMLEQTRKLDFVGFVEPNRIFDDIADVVVTDGYAGNIALKSVEGTVNFIRDEFLNELAEDSDDDAAKLVRKSARKRFRRLMKKLDSQRHNGASFVGLNRVVVKSHNSTTEAGMTAAVDQAVREVELRVPDKIEKFFNKE